MTTVGIIANPASGKDIRRLVAQGSVFDNLEKVNIVRRLLVGLDAAGVETVVFMPEYFGIGRRAVDGLRLSLRPSWLDMPVQATHEDSTLAARLLTEQGVGCIVTLGGDGTNRAVGKVSGKTPLVPISTGTNNVFPRVVEGVIAGLAAGVVAGRLVDVGEVTRPTNRLEIRQHNRLIDIALVDAVVYDDAFIGARAIWDPSKVREMVLARAAPTNIGLSSVGGNLFCPVRARHGVHVRSGAGPLEVRAPIAPGIVAPVKVRGFRLLAIGDEVALDTAPGVLALDGERELEVTAGGGTTVRLSDAGPVVVDVAWTLEAAARAGVFAAAGGAALHLGGCVLRDLSICETPCGGPEEDSPWRQR